MKKDSFRNQQAKGEASLQEKRDQEAADKAKIAKHFRTPEGKEVLELLFRRFGVLGRRFRTPNTTPEQAAISDGEAGAVLFILQCMKDAGEDSIRIPL
jgi:hypothetical protein